MFVQKGWNEKGFNLKTFKKKLHLNKLQNVWNKWASLTVHTQICLWILCKNISWKHFWLNIFSGFLCTLWTHHSPISSYSVIPYLILLHLKCFHLSLKMTSVITYGIISWLYPTDAGKSGFFHCGESLTWGWQIRLHEPESQSYIIGHVLSPLPFSLLIIMSSAKWTMEVLLWEGTQM